MGEAVKPEPEMHEPAPEPVKPAPLGVFAEKVAALALAAKEDKARWKGGVIGDHHLTEVFERHELELTEAWREYVHDLD